MPHEEPNGTQVSIHAARGGGDKPQISKIDKYRVSIHAARGGGDAHADVNERNDLLFQSTPPAGAATARL